MTGALHALPAVPFSALAGLPAASELPKPAHRRRFAQAVACALAHQPSYDLETWPADQLSPVLERRALQADWPMIANADTVVLLRPAPLPETPDALIAEATATLPEPTRTAMTATLHTLWQGGWPTPDLVAATGEAVGEAIRRAARAGNEAAEAALQLAEARALGA